LAFGSGQEVQISDGVFLPALAVGRRPEANSQQLVLFSSFIRVDHIKITYHEISYCVVVHDAFA
jgi:hypothetical protein